MPKKLYQEISSRLQAIENCVHHENEEWLLNHREVVNQIFYHGPSGSGIDCGTKLSFEDSNPEKLVLLVSFHHMNEGGYYDGWTEHKVIVTPSLQHGFNIRITGKNRNDIKEYLHEVYYTWLDEEVKPELKGIFE